VTFRTMKTRRPPRSRHVRAGLAWVGAMLIGAISVAGCGSSSSGARSAGTTTGRALPSSAIYNGAGTVAFLAPDIKITIWSDSWVPQYQSYMHEVAPNVKVLTYYANEDVATQLQQEQAAIAQGAKVLVVAAVNPDQVSGLGNYAQSHGVKIIASNRQFPNFPLSGYVSDDATLIGKIMAKWLVAHTTNGQTIATLWGDATDVVYAGAMKTGALMVLNPLFKSGARKEVGNENTPGYLPANGHAETSALLAKTGNHIDAVLAANDDIASGVVAALQPVGLAGKTKVIGTNASITGVQHILGGSQTATVYNSPNNQEIAAKATAYLLAGKPVPPGLFPSTFPNGTYSGKSISVPFAYQTPPVITKSNVQMLIDNHFLTKALICQGLPTTIAFCA
jgi:D-xylose transport system substrate-binding protein